jgi:hypothetical protein
MKHTESAGIQSRGSGVVGSDLKKNSSWYLAPGMGEVDLEETFGIEARWEEKAGRGSEETGHGAAGFISHSRPKLLRVGVVWIFFWCWGREILVGNQPSSKTNEGKQILPKKCAELIQSVKIGWKICLFTYLA